MPDKGQLLPSVAVRDLRLVAKRVLGTSVTKSRRFKRRRGSGASGSSIWIAKATEAIPAGSGEPREPGVGDGELVKGSGTVTSLENWSTVEIPEGAYMSITDIDGDPVILEAWC